MCLNHAHLQDVHMVTIRIAHTHYRLASREVITERILDVDEFFDRPTNKPSRLAMIAVPTDTDLLYIKRTTTTLLVTIHRQYLRSSSSFRRYCV